MAKKLLPPLVLLLLTAAAQAQAINLDVGAPVPFGSPSNAYGAASGQAGTWNNVSSPSGAYMAAGLLDVSGAVTTVLASAVSTGNGLADFSFDNPLTLGDDGALMDDLQDVGAGASETTWTWSGLQNGAYDVYVYCWAPDSPAFITLVDAPPPVGTIPVGPTDWPGAHIEGATYAKFCVDVTSGTFSVRMTPSGGSFASVNGWQIVPGGTCGAPGTPYCDADGVTSTPCPCSNDNDGSAGIPAGCANANDAAGASLFATGTPSIAAADLVFAGTNLPPNQPGLYFQADNAVAGGGGVVFGDGLRCAGGNVRRLQVRMASAIGTSNTTLDVAATGQVVAGETKRYQLWYRNPTVSPCSASFNLTNGYELTWLP